MQEKNILDLGYRTRQKGDSFYVPANHIHRIIDLPQGDCYTIITPELKVQESSFYQFREDGVYKRFWNESEFKKM